MLLDCQRLMSRPIPPPRRFPGVGEDLAGRSGSWPNSAGGRWAGSSWPTQPRLADRPVVLKVDARGPGGAPLAGPAPAHEHRPALLRAGRSPTAASRSSACRSSAGASLAQVLDVARATGAGPADRAPASSRRSTGSRRACRSTLPARRAVPACTSPGASTSRRSAGSAPAWPTASSTPTTAAWSTWTSSRPTSCSPATASRCSWTSTWPAGRSPRATRPRPDRRDARLHVPRAGRATLDAVREGRAIRVGRRRPGRPLLARARPLRGARRALAPALDTPEAVRALRRANRAVSPGLAAIIAQVPGAPAGRPIPRRPSFRPGSPSPPEPSAPPRASGSGARPSVGGSGGNGGPTRWG